jgi:hypothetical protein
MKKLISKLLKMQSVIFAMLVAGAIVSCDKENVPTQEPEFTPEELAEMAAVEKFAAANSVYRALALIDELPDNWESATYTPAEGVPVDEANSDVRNVVSTGADHAKSYFLSIVPDEGLNGETWSHEGVGTLTFRALNEDNCYAVIDVNLAQMPGLKQLRFVPESVVGENKWQGTPYYAVGDVIKDKKKGTIWICVRPSGGPLAKDNAYFVSFDESLIKTAEQKQDMYLVGGVGENVKKGKVKYEYEGSMGYFGLDYNGKWVYAKNLVEERIALAAAHVFASFADAAYLMDAGVIEADKFFYKGEYLKKFFDPSLLSATEEGRKVFYIAYGSHKNASKQNTQVKYIQPLLSFVLSEDTEDETGIYEECSLQKVTKAWPSLEDGSASGNLLSLTDTHDFFTNAYYLNSQDSCSFFHFTILDYALRFTPEGNPQFSKKKSRNDKLMFMPDYYGKNIPLVMTQMSLKDHGKPASGYELVHQELDPRDEPDYWASIAASTRVVFEEGQEGVRTPITE